MSIRSGRLFFSNARGFERHGAPKVEGDYNELAIRKALPIYRFLYNCTLFLYLLVLFNNLSKHTHDILFILVIQRQVAEQARLVLDGIHDNTHIKENLKVVVDFHRKLQALACEVDIKGLFWLDV